MSNEFTTVTQAERERFFIGNPREYTVPRQTPLQVGFKRLTEDAVIPTKAHASDSGFDLYASEDVIIEPGETAVVPTGIAVQLPAGTEAQVRPRSGVTSKTKLRVQLGTIDNGYGGEIGVIVDNIAVGERFVKDDYVYEVPTEFYELLDGSTKSSGYFHKHTAYHAEGTYLIRKNDRIAQLVVQHLPQVEAVEVTELTESDRSDNGFGSSGVGE